MHAFYYLSVIQIKGTERSMQIIRKGSRSKYPFRFVHSVYVGPRVDWSLATRSGRIASCDALCSRTAPQSVGEIKKK